MPLKNGCVKIAVFCLDKNPMLMCCNTIEYNMQLSLLR